MSPEAYCLKSSKDSIAKTVHGKTHPIVYAGWDSAAEEHRSGTAWQEDRWGILTMSNSQTARKMRRGGLRETAQVR